MVYGNQPFTDRHFLPFSGLFKHLFEPFKALSGTDILSVAIHTALLKIKFGSILAGDLFVVILKFVNATVRYAINILTYKVLNGS